MDKLPSWTKPAIQIAAAGLGAAVAGPLGGAIGGWIADALGKSATELVKKAADSFGEHAAEKLLDTGADSVIDRLKDAPANLATLYRDALRLSLCSIRVQSHNALLGDCDWFTNWNACLTTDVPLNLPSLRPGDIVASNLDNLFCRTLERLDAQGKAMIEGSLALNLETRVIPEPLLATLNDELPSLLNETFAALIVTPAYEQAWKQASQTFQDLATQMLTEIKEDTSEILAGLEVVKAKLDAQGTDLISVRNNAAENAIKDQLLLMTQKQLLEEKAEKEDWRKRYYEVAAQSGPTVQSLMIRGDLSGASQYLQKKIEEQAKAQAENLFLYAKIEELQFHFSTALNAYRQAWKLKPDPTYGFRYAYVAQFQRQYPEAISIYEELLDCDIKKSTRAIVLNNLADVYRSTNQREKAEAALSNALTMHRELARVDAGSQRPLIASVLNNLGVMYAESGRPTDAEAALVEALNIRRGLMKSDPDTYADDLASTLHNLGSFVYVGPAQKSQAEAALGEALHIRRELVKMNPDQYLPRLALTLMNVAQFCRSIGRMENAESAYREAFSIRSKLAHSNPEAYTPAVALSLIALGNLYRDLKRNKDAEEVYLVALSIRRNLADKDAGIYLRTVAETLHELAYLHHGNQLFGQAETPYLEELSIYKYLEEVHPSQYLSNIASVQNSLGVLYGDWKRDQQAENAYLDALSIGRGLAAGDPEKYCPALGRTLNNLAAFYDQVDKVIEAKACCDEAESILTPMANAENPGCAELLAKVLWTRALISRRLGEPATEACVYARRAMTFATGEEMKQSLGTLIATVCEESQKTTESQQQNSRPK